MSDTQDPVSTGESNDPEVTTEGGASPTPTEPPKTTKEENAEAFRLRKTEKLLAAAEAKLATFEKAAADSAKAKLSELERAKLEAQSWKEQAEAAKTQAAQATKMSALKLALKDAKVRSVDAAVKLADLSSIEIDSDGAVTGIDGVITSLKSDFDFLFGSTPPPTQGGGNPAGGAPKIKSSDISQLRGKDWDDFERKVASGEIKL